MFTGNSHLPKWNFLETGQIGDTLGGIMSPFIGIAGVISTFTAFFMQYQANRIQRKQFIKSLNKRFADDEIDSYINWGLMKIDIDNAINDIKNRIKHLNDYIQQVKENP